jgi:uncharacterized protein (DUF924 family)
MSPYDVLDFWFSVESRACWFASTPEFDRQVADRFEALWRAASCGERDEWASSPEGALALVIVLDQFPLHIFRMRPAAWSTEARARAVARRAIDAGFDCRVEPERRGFFYLPFMHSESPADQEYAVSLYEASHLEEGLQWARHHRDLIRRFGRFPHRNAPLGRTSTPEEEEWLRSSEAFRG